MRRRRIVPMLVALMGMILMAGPVAGDSGRPQSPYSHTVPFFPTPKKASFCGEPVPLHIQEVWERFDREFTIVVHKHAQVYLWLKRVNRYFPWLEVELRRLGLPDDLKYVAVAESDLLFYARSPKGATGPWQFIRSTGRRYGLDQGRSIDERRDFELATESALRYLQDLHGMFHNWTLAAAAYNCGEGRVRKAMSQQKQRSYYHLDLPLETEQYIFRILAIKEVLSHPERYGYRLPKEAAYPEIAVDRVRVEVPRSIPLQAAAEAAGTTYRQFRLLNAAFTSDVVPPGAHTIRVPQGNGRSFRKKMESMNARYGHRGSDVIHHRVKNGESLGLIAQRYNVSVRELRSWNNLRGDIIRPDQRLKILK